MSSESVSSRRTFLGGVGVASVAAIASVGSPVDTATAAIKPRPDRPTTATKSGSVNAVVPPLAVRALNRMGYGPARRKIAAATVAPPARIFSANFETSDALGQDDVAYFNSLGSTDDARLAAYVEEQLNPTLIPDPDLNQRMTQYAASFVAMNEPLATAFSTRECDDFDTYARPYRDVEKATFNRAIYSRRQLFELMTDFWHNHFNIFAGSSNDSYASWGSWDRDVIRQHGLGNFYQMLEASAKHPAMLEYLDNYENSQGGFNENYARELFELHTFGAENYGGLLSGGSVAALATNPYSGLGDADLDNPANFNGKVISDPTRPIAQIYVDEDVYDAARALTGWRFHDVNSGGLCGTGAFQTDQLQHDVAGKALLGTGFTTLKSGLAAELEGRLVLKMAAWHPGTATYIARKLCQRLIADNPPESVVQAAAATFYANRLASDQIARTLRVILNSAEFKDPALWGSKTKRPFEVVVSAMRAAGGNYTFREDDASNTSNEFMYYFSLSGQRLFWWRTPDGYPDQRQFWQGTNGLIQVWRAIDWLADRNHDDATRVMRILDITLENIVGNPTARQVVEFWCHWIMGFSPVGGWSGPAGTLIASSPTSLGRAALQFFTQSGYGTDRDRASVSADEDPIPRADLGTEEYQYDWHSRLRGLVELILSSPNFMQR